MEKMGVEQLKALKEQADAEVNLLQDSLTNIRTGTARLDIASTALHELSLRSEGLSTFFLPHPPPCSSSSNIIILYLIHSGQKILVPLTASLYVPGTLDDANEVLVDIGTGYFVEVSSELLALYT